jgi:hypothetical protein
VVNAILDYVCKPVLVVYEYDKLKIDCPPGFDIETYNLKLPG